MNEDNSAEHSYPMDADSNTAGNSEPWLPHRDALEITLSSLVPRAEGLDTDRIVFMVQRTAARSRSRRQWQYRAVQLWAATMTAVAVLLAVLLVRAESKLERLSRTEAAPVMNAPTDPSRQQVPAPAELADQHTNPPDESQTKLTWRTASATDLAQTTLITVRSPGVGARSGSRAEYFTVLDRLLQENVDKELTHKNFIEEIHQINAARKTDSQVPETIRYYEWLKLLLDDHAESGVGNTYFRTPRLTGANL
jgi:hypothetical protein